MLFRIGAYILFSIPLSLVFRALPPGCALKHAFSAVCGAIALVAVVSWLHLAHVLAITGLSYAIARLAPRRAAGPLVFIVCFLHVLAVHVCRADLLDSLLGLAACGSIRARIQDAMAVREFQTAIMAATLKAAGFALSLSDGVREPSKLHPLHQQHRLMDVPSPLRFAGFVLFFPAVLGHPTFFSYAEYEAAAGDVRRCCPAYPRLPLPPVEWSSVLVRMCEGACFGVAHMQVTRFLGGCSAGVYRPLSCYWSSILSIAKFYAFWRMSDAPIVIAGLLPSEQLSGPEHFTRMRSTLLATDFAYAVRMWNLPVARFMKVHVFMRAPRALASSATFAFSALWHGIAAGYCVSAASALLFVTTANELRTRLSPRFNAPPTGAMYAGYCLAGRVLTHFACAITFLPMMTVSAAETLAMLRGLCFAPHLVAIALIAASRTLGVAPRHSLHRADSAAAAVQREPAAKKEL
jgi:hypothetical protein